MCIFRENRTSDCVTFCLLTSQIIIFRVEKVNSGLVMDKKRKWKKRKSLYLRNEKYQLVSSQLATRNEFRDKFLSRINIRTTRDHFISYTLFKTNRNHKPSGFRADNYLHPWNFSNIYFNHNELRLRTKFPPSFK